MKKNILYVMVFLAAVACNKEPMTTPVNEPVAGEGEAVVRLKGEITVPTKVEFSEFEGLFSWSGGNKDTLAIHVSDGKRGDLVFIQHGYKKAAVVPNGPDNTTCDFFFVMSEAQKRDFFALYPASIADEENYGDPDLKVTLPSRYEVSPEGMGGWCPTPMIAVNDADVAGSTLFFNHLGGLLRLTINDVKPGTETIVVSLGKRITGSFTVNDPSGAAPNIETDDTESDEIVFHLTAPIEDATDVLLLNVPVPTGTYGSLTVKVLNEFGSAVYTYEDETVRSFYAGRGRHAESSDVTITIPLCLEAAESGNVVIMNPLNITFEYSYDNRHWASVTSEEDVYIPAEAGQRVYLRGNNTRYNTGHGQDIGLDGFRIGTEGKFYIFGNLLSMIDPVNFDELDTLTEELSLAMLFYGAADVYNHPDMGLRLPATNLSPGCYLGLFAGCSNITEIPELPATTLALWCYMAMCSGTGITQAPQIKADVIPERALNSMFSDCKNLTYAPDLEASEIGNYGCDGMFSGCTSLENAPALPAESIGRDCYSGMFKGCTSLKQAPDLPAVTLAENCYYDMFSGCTSLVSVPASLPAQTLADNCYKMMFDGCTSLEIAPELPATTLAYACYEFMFSGCTSLVSAPPSLPATTLVENCYGEMFYNCTALTRAPVLHAQSLGTINCTKMFNGCTNLNYVKALGSPSNMEYSWWLDHVAANGTFVKNASVTTWLRGPNGIPTGWEVVDATE